MTTDVNQPEKKHTPKRDNRTEPAERPPTIVAVDGVVAPGSHQPLVAVQVGNEVATLVSEHACAMIAKLTASLFSSFFDATYLNYCAAKGMDAVTAWNEMQMFQGYRARATETLAQMQAALLQAAATGGEAAPQEQAPAEGEQDAVREDS